MAALRRFLSAFIVRTVIFLYRQEIQECFTEEIRFLSKTVHILFTYDRPGTVSKSSGEWRLTTAFRRCFGVTTMICINQRNINETLC
jgi:hypothetical protein